MREIKNQMPPDYRPSPIAIESIAALAEAKRMANGIYKDQPPKEKKPVIMRVEADETFGKTVRNHYERQEIAHMGKIDKEKAEAMHAAGASDMEISRKFKVASSSVRGWRKRHNLPPNFKSGRNQKNSQHPVEEIIRKPIDLPIQVTGTIESTLKSDDLIAKIEELQSNVSELLVKNAELAGFIAGAKWASTRLA